ncbi:hypothetical protein [Micromonospora endophytica]|uniref:hypothetical protein n=1 Tax=Micromonospora endophytica TaxID=515350 RepID=UPI0011B6EFDE|nr:hypothetical protein [Micromonospora endophytica]
MPAPQVHAEVDSPLRQQRFKVRLTDLQTVQRIFGQAGELQGQRAEQERGSGLRSIALAAEGLVQPPVVEEADDLTDQGVGLVFGAVPRRVTASSSIAWSPWVAEQTPACGLDPVDTDHQSMRCPSRRTLR